MRRRHRARSPPASRGPPYRGPSPLPGLPRSKYGHAHRRWLRDSGAVHRATRLPFAVSAHAQVVPGAAAPSLALAHRGRELMTWRRTVRWGPLRRWTRARYRRERAAGMREAHPIPTATVRRVAGQLSGGWSHCLRAKRPHPSDARPSFLHAPLRLRGSPRRALRHCVQIPPTTLPHSGAASLPTKVVPGEEDFQALGEAGLPRAVRARDQRPGPAPDAVVISRSGRCLGSPQWLSKSGRHPTIPRRRFRRHPPPDAALPSSRRTRSASSPAQAAWTNGPVSGSKSWSPFSLS